MSDLYQVIGVIFVAAITPGPNNILVLEASLRRDIKGAASIISGIVFGSVIVFFLILIGLVKVMQAVPIATNIIAGLGSLYLIYIGVKLFKLTGIKQGGPKAKLLPGNGLGIVLFQFINPKTWVLLSTVISTSYYSLEWSIMVITLIAVTTFCLLIWAIAGLFLSSIFSNQMIYKSFERGMALSLILLAVSILFKAGSGL